MSNAGHTDPDDSSEADCFFEALETGNLGLALSELSKLNGLDRQDLKRLARLLDDDPDLATYYECMLVLQRRRIGKPSRAPIDQKRLSQDRARAIDREYQKTGKVEAAVAIVGERLNVGRATLMADRKAYKQIGKKKSPTKAE